MKLNHEDFPGLTSEQLEKLQQWVEETGRKLREKEILEEHVQTAKCRHCGERIYLYDWNRWRHTNGMFTCTLQQPRPRPKAEPE